MVRRTTDSNALDSIDNLSYLEKIKSLTKNPVYVGLCLSLTGLYFVVTGVQYWTPNYLTKVLGVPSDITAIFFAGTSISAPISGVIVGGIITTNAGGYNTKKAQKLQGFLGLMAVVFALPIPFVTFKYFGICLWLVLFFGGAILPPVTGIMLNSVSEQQRTSANSIANLTYNLFGYLPAPSFYGMLQTWTGDETSRLPMAMLMYSTLISICALVWSINKKIKNEK
jgi:MFS transporter, Spinster family, sphingosine-1-phosphate transporter